MRSFLRGLTERSIPLKYGVLNARARETWNPSLGGFMGKAGAGWVAPRVPLCLEAGLHESSGTGDSGRRKVSLEGAGGIQSEAPTPRSAL